MNVKILFLVRGWALGILLIAACVPTAVLADDNIVIRNTPDDLGRQIYSTLPPIQTPPLSQRDSIPGCINCLQIPHYQITINSYPPGAEVEVESVDWASFNSGPVKWGTTPANVTVLTGVNTVTLRKAGFSDYSTPITINSGSPWAFEFTLNSVQTPSATQVPHTSIPLPVQVVLLSLTIAVVVKGWEKSW